MEARRTAIVCTLGAASDNLGTVVELARSGMDIARLNMSSGTPSYRAGLADLARRAGRRVGTPISVLADLPGGKIRIGRLPGGRAIWRTSDTVVLTAKASDDLHSHQTWVTSEQLVREVQTGQELLVDDGRIKLRVLALVDHTQIRCLVEHGGEVTDNRGIGAPGMKLKRKAFGPRDAALFDEAVGLGADLIAMSFVSSADDAVPARQRAERIASPPRLLAKIEDASGVAAAAEIANAFDAVIVARGDLGVETPLESLPFVQKNLAAICRHLGTPVWVATELLHSMMDSPRPTRAEVCDIASAVLDGFNACMLCGETGFGSYPAEAVRALARVIAEAEKEIYRNNYSQVELADMAVLNAGTAKEYATPWDIQRVDTKRI